jgi:hypothetical protein
MKVSVVHFTGNRGTGDFRGIVVTLDDRLLLEKIVNFLVHAVELFEVEFAGKRSPGGLPSRHDG